jgi:hypothetical protein
VSVAVLEPGVVLLEPLPDFFARRRFPASVVSDCEPLEPEPAPYVAPAPDGPDPVVLPLPDVPDCAWTSVNERSESATAASVAEGSAF